jgi:hypothetical protein
VGNRFPNVQSRGDTVRLAALAEPWALRRRPFAPGSRDHRDPRSTDRDLNADFRALRKYKAAPEDELAERECGTPRSSTAWRIDRGWPCRNRLVVRLGSRTWTPHGSSFTNNSSSRSTNPGSTSPPCTLASVVRDGTAVILVFRGRFEAWVVAIAIETSIGFGDVDRKSQVNDTAQSGAGLGGGRAVPREPLLVAPDRRLGYSVEGDGTGFTRVDSSWNKYR